MEDIHRHPQSTRKRPRLDSGSRSCSRDPDDLMPPLPSASPDSPGSRVDQQPQKEQVGAGCSPPKTPDRPIPSPSQHGTPSSGTLAINVKPSVKPDTYAEVDAITAVSTVQHGAGPANDDADTSVTERGETPELLHHQEQQVPRSTEPSPMGIDVSGISAASSSPAPSSLQIEVAEVEDMDQDPSMSSWRPLEDALRAHARAEEPDGIPQLQDKFSPAGSFPRSRRNSGIRDAVEDIRKLIEKGNDYDLTMFLAVRGWLLQCLEHLDQITYRSCLANQDLWSTFPNIIDALLRRDSDFQPDAGQGTCQCIESFFIAYAEFAFHMVSLDISAMRTALDNRTEFPELVSKSYWYTLAWLLKYPAIPLYSMLSKIHGSEVANMVARINDAVTQPPINALPQISEFQSLLLECFSAWPTFSPCLNASLQVIHHLVESAVERKNWPADAELVESPVPKNTIKRAYGVVRPTDLAYHAMISKKPPWITSDTTEALIRDVGGCYQLMATFDPDFGLEIAHGLAIEFPPNATAIDDRAHIIALGWRFKLLHKEITDGRMECRVHGVESMQRDLLEAWHQNIRCNPNGVNNAIPQYLVKYIKDTKFVEYIVGVDSHPQLISRSGNIVGFLVVTYTYTNEDTDVIWRSVTESQDARFVAEVLGLVGRLLPLMPTTDPMLYLCQKLLELPLDRFDLPMIELFDELLKHYIPKHCEKSQSEPFSETPDCVDILPVKLCVRMIREVRSAETLSAEQKTQIQRVASRQLSQLISCSISDSDKVKLFKMCTDDIAEMNEFAVGSVHALLSLTSPYDTGDIAQLAYDFGLTRLIIAELANSIETTSPEAAMTGDQKAALVPRIQLLLRIVEKIPDTISMESSQTLWDSLFMSKAVDENTRSLVWDMLSKSLARCAKRNDFFERVMNDFLPRIPPEEFGPFVLAFAEQAVTYELRFDCPPVHDEGEVISIPGMERIWDIILTAPPNTVEMKAINFAIDTYLDDSSIRNAPRSAAEATHVALVDRCVQQLRMAASKLKNSCESTSSGEDEPMVIIPSDRELRLEELRFSRSLLFLRQLLHGLRTRPHYTPPQNSPTQLVLKPDQVKGDLIDLRYQAFDIQEQTQIKKLQIGDLSTAGELMERLQRITGFPKFSTISAGKPIDLLSNSAETLRDLRLARGGLLIVRRLPDDNNTQPVSSSYAPGRRQSLTLVDTEVLKHFDDLYDLLVLDDRLSKEIFDFLVVFPPQTHVRDFVRSSKTTCAEMFPLEKPYKLLYSIHCLATCLREETSEVNPDKEFIDHSILNLAEFLTLPDMEVSLEESLLRLTFAHNAVDCLAVALIAKPYSESSETFFPDASILTTRLLNLLSIGQKTDVQPFSEAKAQKLISNCLTVLIEASVHDSVVWDILKQNARIEESIYDLLLAETRQGVRKEVEEILSRLCRGYRAKKQMSRAKADEDQDAEIRLLNPTIIDIISTLWKVFLSLFPRTLGFPASSQEFFEVAIVILQQVADLSPLDLAMGEYMLEWGEILLKHRTNEFVGRERVDYVVLGFTVLIRTCLDLAPSDSVTDNTSSLVEQLFTTFLFPNLSEPDGTELIKPSAPVMHSLTRHELYMVLLKLCNNWTNCEQTLNLLEDVIPRDYTYDPNWVYDRYKTIRAPEGYAGMRNLSNTCYLNSLFTQLFMNMDFRKFMLGMEVTEPDDGQKLLGETKKLFAYMQNTWQKSVDPSAVVESIQTFDNEAIDINIQMDVDEFFNLLFDRWEGQISSPEDKKKFRSFYGGQLVQQVKSKECEHISERFEPFFAIQCEIKGKSNLEESLRAYVEGETMQGDNKYSCTSCGRHVDAVKRACLKDLPDNLIFHLKRFDFDVISMVRSKINDEFHFPEHIDMTPFKVEHLSDPSAPAAPDIFELVGVLVHSGTAETGHYYSYIKERPALAGSGATWVEFNDSDVSRFDPGKIPDQCFGGLTETSFGSVRFNKVWNAYMLFYQRVTNMETTREVYQPSPNGDPVTVPVQLDLGNHISMGNELFIRTFCLLDQSHAYFVRGLLEQSKRLAATSKEAGPAAKIQRLAVSVALDNFEQLISRSKELPELDKLLYDLNKTVQNNPDGAIWVLDWTMKRPDAIRNLLIKSPVEIVREGFGLLLAEAFATQKARVVAVTATDSPDAEEDKRYSDEYHTTLYHVVLNLQCSWPLMQSHSRAWDQFFAVILAIARLGYTELEFLLDARFLLRCLEIVWLDRKDNKCLRTQYPVYFRLLEKGRKFSHYKMTELLSVMLAHINLSLTPTPDGDDRESRNGKFALSLLESELVLAIGQSGELLLLKKLIEQQANLCAVRKIVALFVNPERAKVLGDSVCKTLEEGLRADPASLAIPFLDATAVYCQVSSDATNIIRLVDHTSKGVETINGCAGKEHLDFFRNLADTENDRLPTHDDFWFWTLVVERIPEWAPTLLHYPDEAVRANALDFLRRLLFSKGGPDPDTDNDNGDEDENEGGGESDATTSSEEFNQFYRRVGRDLATACVNRLVHTYFISSNSMRVDQRVISQITQVVSFTADKYFDKSGADEDDASFVQRANGVVRDLGHMSVEVSEDLASGSEMPSDWEDNSAIASDSDVGLPGSP